MISVGSGGCIFLEPNQLQADKQVNVTSTKTLNRYSHALLSKHQPITHSPWQLPFSVALYDIKNGTDIPGLRPGKRGVALPVLIVRVGCDTIEP
jgi:hypothetical protein